MKVVCESCRAGYSVVPPPWVLASGRLFDAQCTACGHRQKARPTAGIALLSEGPPRAPDVSTPVRLHTDLLAPDGALPLRPGTPADADDLERAYVAATAAVDVTVADSPAFRPLPRPSGPTWTLRHEDETYEVPDLPTLRRWVTEMRVVPTDELRVGDSAWTRVSDHHDLREAFAAAAEGLRANHDSDTTARPLTDAPPVRGWMESTDDADPTMESLRQPTEELPAPVNDPVVVPGAALRMPLSSLRRETTDEGPRTPLASSPPPVMDPTPVPATGPAPTPRPAVQSPAAASRMLTPEPARPRSSKSHWQTWVLAAAAVVVVMVTATIVTATFLRLLGERSQAVEPERIALPPP